MNFSAKRERLLDLDFLSIDSSVYLYFNEVKTIFRFVPKRIAAGSYQPATNVIKSDLSFDSTRYNGLANHGQRKRLIRPIDVCRICHHYIFADFIRVSLQIIDLDTIVLSPIRYIRIDICQCRQSTRYLLSITEYRISVTTRMRTRSSSGKRGYTG